jgi:hypothetical protein
LVASCAKSTQTQYQSYIERYTTFCSAKGVNNNNTNVNLILEFLYSLYMSGLGYSSINTARSALSLFLPSIEGLSIGVHPTINRFVKGVSKLRPPQRRYNDIWNVDLLLNV